MIAHKCRTELAEITALADRSAETDRAEPPGTRWSAWCLYKRV
jgi:hypothetical protein